jgi:cyclic beta-1,2-glucan synthetase
VEAILGLRLRGTVLTIEPCIPKRWRGFEIVFRHRSSLYEIAVENPRGVSRGVVVVELNGTALPVGSAHIPLSDDRGTHRVRVVLG